MLVHCVLPGAQFRQDIALLPNPVPHTDCHSLVSEPVCELEPLLVYGNRSMDLVFGHVLLDPVTDGNRRTKRST